MSVLDKHKQVQDKKEIRKSQELFNDLARNIKYSNKNCHLIKHPVQHRKSIPFIYYDLKYCKIQGKKLFQKVVTKTENTDRNFFLGF